MSYVGMSNNTSRPPDVDAAYALSGIEECRRLYADWADSYDQGFAQARGYILPAQVAAAWRAAAAPRGPVLDVGAGTGLVAQALRMAGHAGAIDAVDLSAEMLEIARAKQLYRHLITADITQPLPAEHGPWAGFLSAGTFTHGHVGPEALPPLLDRAIPGAVVAFAVNLGVWEARGFPQALAALAPRITDPEMIDTAIYGAGGDDRARIVRFSTR